MEDETSPLLCDPLNADDYTYSILSKPLVKPVKPAKPAVTATSAPEEEHAGASLVPADYKGGKMAAVVVGEGSDGRQEEREDCALDHLKVNTAVARLNVEGSDPQQSSTSAHTAS